MITAKVLSKNTLIRLGLVWVLVFLFVGYGKTVIGEGMSPLIAGMSFLILLFTIIGASFGVVKEADELAEKLGEPYGTLILTLSVVAIEVILISAVLLGPGESPPLEKIPFFQS